MALLDVKPPPTPNTYSIRPLIIGIVGVAIILSVYFHIRINLTDIPLNRDEGGFAFFGRMIAQGGTLYRDGMDHKPPGIWLIYAALSYLVPFTARGLHWAVQIYNLATLVLLGLLCRRLFDWKTAFWTVLFFSVVTSGPEVEGSSASAELFMLLPMVASLLLCVMGNEEGRPSLIYAAGLLSGMAFWIKQPAAAVTLFLVAYLLIDGMAKGKAGMTARRIALFLLGLITVSAAVAGWFYLQGTLSDLIYWSFSHNLEYVSGASGAGILEMLRVKTAFVFRSNPPAWILAVAACIFLPFRARSRGWLIVGFLVSSVIAAAHSPALYRHYFALVCPALSLAAGVGVSQTMGWWENRSCLRPWVFAGLILLIVGTPLYIHRAYYFHNSPTQNSRVWFGANPFPESATVADYLRRKTGPRDTVLILGSEPQILIMADRESATRHPFFYQVVGPYRRSREFQAQVIDDFERNKPAYVVVVNHSQSWMADPDTSQAFVGSLNRILNENYRLDALVIRDTALGVLFECGSDPAHCRAVVAASAREADLETPVMVLYRRSRDPA